jgi:ssDNA-binding Zn-finger/Zn-ribbon topoisomerase 1
MRFVTMNTGSKDQQLLWMENCMDCHIPMRKVMREAEDIIMGKPETYKWRPLPNGFSVWSKNPIITGNDLWFCEGCKSLWAAAQGHWAKATFNGSEILNPEEILPPLEIDLKSDAGPQPFPESTRCPECHSWRLQQGDWQICPKCGTGSQVIINRVPDFPTGMETNQG